MNRIVSVQVCDATGADECYLAGFKKMIVLSRKNLSRCRDRFIKDQLTAMVGIRDFELIEHSYSFHLC